MKKSIIIIGAGIAGLTAGCYAQLSGYESRIFEMHSIPGGLCTSWKRKGYTIDGCIHWLVGSGKKCSYYRMWDELGVAAAKNMIHREEHVRFELGEGKAFIAYSNVDRLEQHMKDIAPEDAPLIEELAGTIRKLAKLKLPLLKSSEINDFFENLRYSFGILSCIKSFAKFSRLSVGEFAQQFKSPILREWFPRIIDVEGFPMISFLVSYSWFHNQCAGYPEGGSLEFSKSVEKSYRKFGGEVCYKSRVVKILCRDNRAVGIRLEDGSEHFADYIISAADGYTTLFKMLDQKYITQAVSQYYTDFKAYPPIIQISFGVNCDLSNEPYYIYYPIKNPVEIHGQKQAYMIVRNYSFDRTLAPAGKTLLVAYFETNYSYWKGLSGDRNQYLAEKKRLTELAAALLEERFPEIAGKIEIADMATPVTYERYTGNWQGSYEGWLLTKYNLNSKMVNTIKNLDGFYMAGQWVMQGGGVTPSAGAGREVVRMLCKRDKKRFKTSV